MYKRRAIISAGVLYVLIILTSPLLFFGKDLEEKLFPVVTDTQLLRVESVDGNSVKIWVAFKKVRSCTFVDLAWYKVDPVTDQQTRIPFAFLEDNGQAPVSRPPGYQGGGPWLLGVSPDNFMGQVVAHARHRCHPLWDTRSQFFPN